MKIHVQSLHKNRLFAGWEMAVLLANIIWVYPNPMIFFSVNHQIIIFSNFAIHIDTYQH